MPKAFFQERKRDYFYRKAKKERYRSRAVYKLLEAIRKYGFIKRGDLVVDLGAAPGGWVQGCLKVVGREGFILAVDLKPMRPFGADNIHTLVADISEPETLQKIRDSLPRRADAVICDAAPDISGIWEVDHARQISLANSALRIAESILSEGGNFFVKIFEGDLSRGFREDLGEKFEYLRIFRPKASRKRSAEIYLLGLKYKLKNANSRTNGSIQLY